MDMRFMPKGCTLDSVKNDGGFVYVTVKREADGMFFCCGYREKALPPVIRHELNAFSEYVASVRLGGQDLSLGEGELGMRCKVDGEPGFTIWMVDESARAYGVKRTGASKRANLRKVAFSRVQWDDGKQVA